MGNNTRGSPESHLHSPAKPGLGCIMGGNKRHKDQNQQPGPPDGLSPQDRKSGGHLAPGHQAGQADRTASSTNWTGHGAARLCPARCRSMQAVPSDRLGHVRGPPGEPRDVNGPSLLLKLGCGVGPRERQPGQCRGILDQLFSGVLSSDLPEHSSGALAANCSLFALEKALEELNRNS